MLREWQVSTAWRFLLHSRINAKHEVGQDTSTYFSSLRYSPTGNKTPFPWRLLKLLQPGLWGRSRNPGNFGWLEPETKMSWWWSRSLKFGFRFHRRSLWGKRVYPILQWFWFSMDQIVLEPEPKTSPCRNWSVKFEFRLHSPDCSTWLVLKICVRLKKYLHFLQKFSLIYHEPNLCVCHNRGLFESSILSDLFCFFSDQAKLRWAVGVNVEKMNSKLKLVCTVLHFTVTLN